MEKESVVKVPQGYQKLSPVETPKKKKKIKLYWSLIFIAMLGLVYSIVTICHLKWEVELLQKKMSIMQVFVEKDIELFKNVSYCIFIYFYNQYYNKIPSNFFFFQINK